MSLTIEHARVIDPSTGTDTLLDIHIKAGKVVGLGTAPTDFVANEVINAKGLIAAPGLVDVNVALCEPGYTHKGTIATETKAASAGGVTSLCCSPYTKPIADSPAVIELIIDRAKESGYSKVYPLGALTKNCAGEHLAELVSLAKMGCVAFTDELAKVSSNRILRQALDYAATFDLQVVFTSQDADLAEGGVAHEGIMSSTLGLAGIPEVAETIALARNLLLVEQTGVRAHFSCITTAKGAELIANAQAKGLPVTADTALYQLILTDEALSDFSSLLHVQPPLRTLNDREALREAVKSGVIQSITSYHRPHEKDAKAAPFAQTEPGISGVELLLPLAMTLVEEGVLDMMSLLACLTMNPARAFRLPAGKLSVGACADIVVFDPHASTIVGDRWYSKGQNNPFMGQCLPTKIHATLVDGRIVYRDGE